MIIEKKNIAPNLRINQLPRLSKRRLAMVGYPWVGHWILESRFMSWLKAQWKYESDYVYCPVIWKWLHRAFHDCLPQNCLIDLFQSKFYTNVSLPFVAKWMAVLVAVLIQLKIILIYSFILIFQIKPLWHRVETNQHVRVILRHLVSDKGWTLMMTHWKVKILTPVNSVSPNGLKHSKLKSVVVNVVIAAICL